MLHQKINDALKDLGIGYEIIFVNDGSKDNTFPVAKKLAESDPNLRVIQLRKNYGQTPAMAAGIDHARGSILATMDGDLQNDPSDLPMMLEELQKGYDIVVGWRHKRQDKLISRKIPSVIANRLIGKVTGVPIKDNGCSLKVYRASLMQSMPFYNEMHRFIPALLSVSGSKVSEVKVKHHARQFGESKYGLSRIYKVLLDLLTMKTLLSVADHPSAWFGRLSIPPFFISFLCMLMATQNLLSEGSMLIYSATSLIFFSFGVFLVGLGFICELVLQKGSLKINDLALLTAKSYSLNKD